MTSYIMCVIQTGFGQLGNFHFGYAIKAALEQQLSRHPELKDLWYSLLFLRFPSATIYIKRVVLADAVPA